jgi:hypothetical protein
MAMTGRFVNLGVRITASLALLLAVISSPIRPSKPFGAPTSRNCLADNFAFTMMGANHLDDTSSGSSVTKADRVVAVVEDELDAELEDELHATSQPSCVMFDVLRSSCSENHRKLIGCAVERATRPLRC